MLSAARKSAVLLLAMALVPVPAFAYIDPNTGGMLFQILAPILAMITSAWLFARDKIKSIWYRIVRVFVPRKNDAVQPGNDASKPPK